MNCRYCSTELPEGALFCGECGRSVRATAAPFASAASTEAAPDEPASAEAAQVEPASSEADASEEASTDSATEPGTDAAELVDRCTHCGAELADSDIFCGECGLVRQAVAAGRPLDTVVLPELPPPLVAPASPPPAPASPSVPEHVEGTNHPAPPADNDFDPDLEQTRIVDRSAKGERFVLQFSTGESVSVTGTGLVGRNPIAEPGEYFDHVVPIVDPGKSVSKTHLEFGQEGGAFWVSDRYSGNGTIVREPEAPALRCDPGKRYRVVRGSRIEIGEQFFIVS